MGGRWNSVGKTVIYTSTSLALSRLEKLVQLDSFNAKPKGLGQIEIEVPDDVEIEKYPRQNVPASEQKSKVFGDAWIEEKRTLILLVPSIASYGDWNAVINPDHADFGRLSITPEKTVRWDKRLFGKNKQFQKLK